jgi:hypothetical protein
MALLDLSLTLVPSLAENQVDDSLLQAQLDKFDQLGKRKDVNLKGFT